MTAATTEGLRVEGLTFSYGPRLALDGIGFHVEPGQLCCLLGPNGAGKTTLIRCIVGLATANAGTVRVGAEELTTLTAPQRARRIAYLSQSVNTAFEVTVTDVVATGRTAYVPFGRSPSAHDITIVHDALAWTGISHLADRPFHRLSGGERQLCGIARALAQATAVVVLDEPTSALDFGNQVRVLGILRELADSGKAVLMTSHAPNQALEAADSALLLSEGRLVAAGTPHEVIDGPALSALYGVQVSVAEVSTCFGRRRVCVPEISLTTAAPQGMA